ncbi:IS110 family transposase [Kiritimatiella glycovorans]|uniref:Transposase IS116/IS110/IS902 family protein n=1 Tax=Kiritimatiella glycovorans TaxID=1307763 RepID=A0A0G3EF17_9BACT|nr:IS110 family transposase [Kiritimatiella glycovorans]AKJ63360.1 Transposase IS116/IS110/IS902 family protein [Kiritimatiella glycovorans]
MQTTSAKELYAGADLHGNNVFLSICDREGTEVFRRRVRTTLDAVNEAMDPYWPQVQAMGIESTFNWYWLVDGLREQNRDVRLGNPAKMKQYKGLKHADDASDARWLAELLRLDIFPESYIYPKEVRSIRDALRRRQLFVRRRTQVMLSLQSLLERYGFKAPGSRALQQWTQADAEATGLDPFVQLQLRTLLEAVQCSERLAGQIESAVLGFIEPNPSFEQVQTVPGIGKALGMTIVLESGNFARFPNAGCYASYCRAVKSERSSNSRKKGENNKRNGNPFLAWAFVEAASFAPRFYPEIQSWYDRKKKKRNAIVAKKALAAKLSKAVWHVMNGEEYVMGMLF